LRSRHDPRVVDSVVGVSDNPVITLDPAAEWEPPEPSHRPSLRWLAVVLVLAGVCALVTGAQPITSLTPSVVLPGQGISAMHSDADALYLVRHLDTARAQVESYRMPGGEHRWSSPVDTQAHVVGVHNGRLLFYVEGTSEPALMALDTATGAQVWRRAGYTPMLYDAAGGTGIVVAQPYQPGPEPLDQPPRDQPLVGIDSGTGEFRWSIVTPAGTMRSFAYVGEGLADIRVEIAELDPAGVVRIRSGESAEVMRTARLDLTDRFGSFEVVGLRLLAYRSGELGTFDGAMFDLTTGRMLWRRQNVAAHEPLWWCGPVLCAGSQNSIAVVDPDTGRERWRLDGWTSFDRLDGNRMLATRIRPDGSPQPDALVVDTATGKVVQKITDWEVASRQTVSAGVILVNRDAGGTSLVARLDVATGTVRVIGRSERWIAVPSCVATETVLACVQGQVLVWRLPRD
jgi:outer membrane protein assembly factor BamB